MILSFKKAMSYLIDKVNNLEELIRTTASTQPDENTWYDIDAVCDYLPGSPAKQTVYGWVFQKKIPYHKKSRKLLFLKSELDEWLISDKHAPCRPGEPMDFCLTLASTTNFTTGNPISWHY